MGNNETSEVSDINDTSEVSDIKDTSEKSESQDSGQNLERGPFSNEWYNISGVMPCPEEPHYHLPFE